jgi:hypothetical protein
MPTRPLALSCLLLLGALAACDGSPGPTESRPSFSSAEVTRSNTVYQIDLTFDCRPAGGEVVEISGPLHETVTTVQKADGFTYATLTRNAQGITAVGLSTGAVYRAPGMGLRSSKFRFPRSSDSFVTSFLDLTHLVRPGSAGAGTLWATKIIGHITLTPTGKIIEQSLDASDCVAL